MLKYRLPPLIKNLMANLQHGPEASKPNDVTLLETHISWVILTGSTAYKIKKPVNLGYLDFSALAQRQHYCEEELRLNDRLAEELYIGITPINGTEENPTINGDGPIIEYAIHMRQFPQSAQLDNRLEQKLLTPENMASLADLIATFHQRLPAADSQSEYGDVTAIQQAVDDNFKVLKEYFGTLPSHAEPQDLSEDQKTLDQLQDWVAKQNEALRPTFIQRKQNGFIRECHGDLHLRNLIWLDDHPIAFDCLEFDESLRWTDVMCEVAFLVMDLMSKQQTALAYAFLNQYLQHTGDYAGLALLPYYISYRALVRAKVDAQRHQQAGVSAHELEATDTELRAYMDLALQITQQQQPTLIITRGMSASGKSTITQPLASELGAIRIRSDVERKRMHGLEARESAASEPNTGLYTEQADIETYGQLLNLAEQTLSAGFDVIVDTVFMHKAQRIDTLRQRVKTREKEASDAGLTILEHQLSQWLPLQVDESSYRIEVNTESHVDMEALVKQLGKCLLYYQNCCRNHP